jgi:hypothetical protein
MGDCDTWLIRHTLSTPFSHQKKVDPNARMQLTPDVHRMASAPPMELLPEYQQTTEFCPTPATVYGTPLSQFNFDVSRLSVMSLS